MKIAIVSPEVMGVHRNGGVGTHVYWLARVLAKVGHSVDIVYIGDEAEPKNHKELFDDYKINLVILKKIIKTVESNISVASNYHDLSAYHTYRYTRDKNYDVIHFQDLSGNGCYACMVKKLGLGYKSTQLITTIHSNNRWVREGTHVHRINYDSIDLQVDSFEDMQVQLSDATISPSYYMKNWYINQGILLDQSDCEVIPYCYMPLKEETQKRIVDITHLAFFSRLETRKGIDIFCEGLDIYLATHAHKTPLKQISFIGRFGRINAHELSQDYLMLYVNKWQNDFGIKINILTEFESLQAKAYLVQTGAVVVVPTRLDNLPFVTIESVENKLPILVANTGGVKEVLSGDNLFEANKYAFAEKIKNLYNMPLTAAENLLLNYTSHYKSTEANQQWIDYHDKYNKSVSQTGSQTGSQLTVLCVLAENLKALEWFLSQNKHLINIDLEIFGIIKYQDKLVYWQYNDDIWKVVPDKGEKLFFDHAMLFVTSHIVLIENFNNFTLPTATVAVSAYINARRELVLPYATKELLLTKPVMGQHFAAVSADIISKIGTWYPAMLFADNQPSVWNIIFRAMLQAQQTLIIPDALYGIPKIPKIEDDFYFNTYRLDCLKPYTNRLINNLIVVDYYPMIVRSQQTKTIQIMIDDQSVQSWLYQWLSRLAFKYKRILANFPWIYKLAFKAYNFTLRCIKKIT